MVVAHENSIHSQRSRDQLWCAGGVTVVACGGPMLATPRRCCCLCPLLSSTRLYIRGRESGNEGGERRRVRRYLRSEHFD